MNDVDKNVKMMNDIFVFCTWDEEGDCKLKTTTENDYIFLYHFKIISSKPTFTDFSFKISIFLYYNFFFSNENSQFNHHFKIHIFFYIHYENSKFIL